MDVGADTESSQDWQSPEHYAPLLILGRRALAWQCLCRDHAFLNAAQSVVPASIDIVRNDPPIIVATLLDEDRLASWGVHFCAMPNSADGGGLCRLAGG